MKDERIVAAYDRIAPDEATAERMLEQIMARAETERAAPPRRKTGRRVLLIAACVAGLALLSTGGFAAFRRWSLPEPKQYEAPEDGGYYQVVEQSDYTAPIRDEEVAPLSDQDFMLSAQQILRTAGFEQVEPSSLRVVRQENLYWSRTEAEVFFEQDGVNTSVKFNAETGQFLGLSSIDWVSGGEAEETADPQTLAERYYRSLPVPQDYVLTDAEQYDEQFWNFDFCREVLPGIFSSYETVRISVNPVSGRLCGCTVFYVPLLDDHLPEDVPLTQEEAEAAAREAVPLDGYVLRAAELSVCLPNWMYTPKQAAADVAASDVTRLCWLLHFERPGSEFADEILLMVDYYTGELLGGDATK